jgi:hypothetical protein
MGSGLKTGRRIFYLKVEKVEEEKNFTAKSNKSKKSKKERGGSLKNLFDFMGIHIFLCLV